MRSHAYVPSAGCHPGFAVIACAACLGCGLGQTEPEAAKTEQISFVAAPCAGLELGEDPLDPKSARVFVEVADVAARELPQPVATWLEQNAVKVRATAQVVAFPDVPTSTPWGLCVDAVCEDMKLSLTVTPRLPARASEPIRLELRVDESAEDGSSKLVLETSIETPNQKPAVLPPAALTDGSIVVTPYLLRRHDDLHRVLECRAKQAERLTSE